MFRIFYTILFTTLFVNTDSTISYASINSWCSNGKYSSSITPFPKPTFNKCPAYAQVIMSLKEVEEYYIDGIGQEYLCKLVETPLFFAPTSTHKTESHRIIKKLFVNKQILVEETCNLFRTQKIKKMNISNAVSSKGEMTYLKIIEHISGNLMCNFQKTVLMESMFFIDLH